MRILLVLPAVLLLASCGDPLRDVTRLNEIVEPEALAEAPSVVETQEERQGGFFGAFLRRTGLRDGASEEASAALDETPSDGDIVAAIESDVLAEDASVTAEAEIDPEVVEPRRAGFRLWPFGRRDAQPEPEQAAVVTSEDGPGTVENSDAGLELETPPLEEEAPRRRGLFGLGRADPVLPDGTEVEPGTRLAFGEIASVCGLPRRELGTEVARFPDRRGGFRLYDTIPNATAPRTFYITGFQDDCARQITANVVTPGDPFSHEFVRYEATPDSIPYSRTDLAYELVKNSICGVRDGQPCGNRIDTLERNTVFLSVYERFGTNAQWVEILLHDGRVLAIDFKGG